MDLTFSSFAATELMETLHFVFEWKVLLRHLINAAPRKILKQNATILLATLEQKSRSFAS